MRLTLEQAQKLLDLIDKHLEANKDEGLDELADQLSDVCDDVSEGFHKFVAIRIKPWGRIKGIQYD